MPNNVYIHIPFCKSKCHYCSFVSSTDTQKLHDYLDALEKEIKHFYKGEKINTLYFGGGTPSLLSADDIKRISELFNINNETEFTVEINPDTVDKRYLNELLKCKVNRLSIGCQTFDDNILKIINRRHNAKQVKDTVKSAQETGFKNISLDFIYGLPTQTLQGFEKDLKTALNLRIQHISLYGLKIDENCYFYKNRPENLPDEDLQADMYMSAVKILKAFNHYEISNFGIPSKHNLNYWNNQNYYGFGVSAHGYADNIRYSNTSDINKYLICPIKHENEIKLTTQQILEEEIFLGLRKTEGINIPEINKKFKINFLKKYRPILEKYRDYLVLDNNNLSFNTKGILVSNVILSEFLE